MLNFVGSKWSALGSIDMFGLKFISMGRELWSVKSIISGNDFVCPRSFSDHREEIWDQSGGDAPSQEESSIEESSLFCKLL